jgi:FkbM family methyltransferase
MAAARVIYHPLHFVLRGDQRTIKRNGITYDVDISEGVELSLFVFGGFQPHVLSAVKVPDDWIVFDVGANIGTVTLPLAKRVQHGRVFAFEPTHYTFARLERNLALNPHLAARVVAVQAFLSDSVGDGTDLEAVASWRVDRAAPEAHPLSGGSVQDTTDVPATTLDAFCVDQDIHRVDFIKIDTEGHELDVLSGAIGTLTTHRPPVVFEMGLYALADRGQSFGDFEALFTSLDYRLINTKTGRVVTQGNHHHEVPERSTTDLLAEPQ